MVERGGGEISRHILRESAPRSVSPVSDYRDQRAKQYPVGCWQLMPFDRSRLLHLHHHFLHIDTLASYNSRTPITSTTYTSPPYTSTAINTQSTMLFHHLTHRTHTTYQTPPHTHTIHTIYTIYLYIARDPLQP
jgi:hypothetical protein